MRYAHIFCGWSKRLKPNESRPRLHPHCLVVLRGEHLAVARTQALLDEAINDPSKIAFDNLDLPTTTEPTRPVLTMYCRRLIER